MYNDINLYKEERCIIMKIISLIYLLALSSSCLILIAPIRGVSGSVRIFQVISRSFECRD